MTSATTPEASRFRPDVEGLRAIAVGLVLWYHASLPLVSGGFAGVDVFFVISGFLITGQLVREVERTGRVSLPRFYARRAKRLFPAAATVLVATAAMVLAFFPRATWRDFGGDIAGSAAYIINWRLAERSVDYLAEDTEQSPVQHFWSLAVEEQYYIIWPLLIIAIAVAIRRWRLPVRTTLGLTLAALIVLPSLAWSVHLTSTQAPRAYFVTTTRLWELAIGALVAIGSHLWPRIPAAAAAVIGWSGLAVIGAGALLQDSSTPWPGTAALVPTLGAAAVVVAGFAAGRLGPVQVLGRRLMTWIGGLSYSLYLWHWPMVVTAAQIWPGSRWASVGAVMLSFVPAWLTYRFVEGPVRFHPLFARRARPALLLGLALSLVGVLVGLGVTQATPQAQLASAQKAVGAAALAPDPDQAEVRTAPGPMTPDPLKAVADVPSAYARDCQVVVTGTGVKTCEFGDPKGKTTIALVGDSKALQWLPALEEVAQERSWRIVTYTRSACAFSATITVPSDDAATKCLAWGKEVIGRLTTTETPDVVLTSAVRREGRDESGTSEAALGKGYAAYWQRLREAGAEVGVITDTPQPGKQVYACVAEHLEDYMSACQPTYDLGAGTEALLAGADQVDGVEVIDVLPWVCPRQTCWPVIGEVLVYRQGSHVTATYARSMSEVIVQGMEPLLTG